MSSYMKPNYGEWAVVAIIIFFTIVALAPVAGSALTAKLQLTHTVPIATLNDDSLTSGIFVLGSGTIKEEPVYVSYAKLENGGYKMVTFSADRSTIFTDTDENPHVLVYECQSDWQIPLLDHCPWAESEFDIHVPKGTIEQPMYALDGRL